jgi:hypothetical protein
MDKLPVSILPYLEEISQCLWSKNASIMIGAGFSMNAKPIFENSKPFPNWQDLGNIFYRKVRGEEIKEAQYNFFDPLKLAYEVEANFGRSVLDSILRTSIPDSDYKPSSLHHSLLSLPWTDVFTTNYDTLLERSADTVSERNYKVVVNKDDLVHSVSPRIVKLHGCFSASTPLIISEEDYRVYPQKYAPFVNTVQQNLLENTLCLIGFSGDDPNFLKWIGWIRDNLGVSNAPKIYLIGVLNLSASQEKALAQYNITCVDMSDCEGVDEKDHQAGIIKFINFCESRKNDESQRTWELSYSNVNIAKEALPEDINKELHQLVELWSKERSSYPNWLVVPHDLRKKLWVYTKPFSLIFNKYTSISLPLLKDFVYEFLWRKEKSLLPIFDNEIELILLSIKPDFEVLKSANNKELGKTFYIMLALLRYYREEGKNENWWTLFNTISECFKEQHYNDYLTYEKALQLLFGNNGAELKILLSKWSSGNLPAIWMYRKASILAEVNQLTDAKETLEKALVKTRRKINTVTTIGDYANVSLESYILVSLTNVNHALLIKEDNFFSDAKKEYLERLNDLRQYQCNPWQEIQLLELEIKHDPVISDSTSITYGFDIGSQTTSHHFIGDNVEVLNAFRLLRFFEDAALPISLQRMNIAVKSAENAIKRAAIYAPHWSMCTMLRTRNKNSSELIFTRETLAKLETHYINELGRKYIDLLSSFLSEEDSLYEYGAILPEALSRLCCRLTVVLKDDLLELIIKIYDRKSSALMFQSINMLIKRLILSYRDVEVFQRIEKITMIAHSVVKNEREIACDFPNPFKYLLDLPHSTLKLNKEEIRLSTYMIKSLLNSVESNNKDVRKNSSLALINLKALGLLNKNQIKGLLTKLLSQTDAFFLPDNTFYYKFYYINLFEGKNTIVQGVKTYLLQSAPYAQAEQDTPNSYGMTNQSDIYTIELLGGGKLIKWTNDELHVIARKLLKWWEGEKYIFFEDNKSHIFDEMSKRFSLFVDCIDLVIIQNELFEYENEIIKIAQEFEIANLKYLHLKAVTKEYLNLDNLNFVLELEEAISSSEKTKVLDALLAIDYLVSKQKLICSKILDVFLNFLRYSRDKYLVDSFNIVSQIIKKDPQIFIKHLETGVLDKLNKIILGFKELSFSENLQIKESAAALANTLNHYYNDNNISRPETILQWEKICASDTEFSEIRNQWLNE